MTHESHKTSLMELPTEIRLMVLGYLLPDQKKILNPVNRLTKNSKGLSKDELFRKDGAAVHTSVLRVNKKLYKEGIDILYDREITVAFSYSAELYGIAYHRVSSANRLIGPDDNIFAKMNIPFHLFKLVTIEYFLPYGMGEVLRYNAFFSAMYGDVAEACNGVNKSGKRIEKIQTSSVKTFYSRQDNGHLKMEAVQHWCGPDATNLAPITISEAMENLRTFLKTHQLAQRPSGLGDGPKIPDRTLNEIFHTDIESLWTITWR